MTEETTFSFHVTEGEILPSQLHCVVSLQTGWQHVGFHSPGEGESGLVCPSHCTPKRKEIRQTTSIHPSCERYREEWLYLESHFQVSHSVLVLQLMNDVILISVSTWVKYHYKDA